MNEKINDIKNLSNEDLLTLHAKIEEHLKYLDDSVISLEAEAGDTEAAQASDTGEASESSETSDDNAEEDGGEEDE